MNLEEQEIQPSRTRPQVKTPSEKYKEFSKAYVLTPWLKVSVATKQGNVRTYMEDRPLVASFSVKRKGETALKFHLIGVLDGHGGSEAVDYVYIVFVKLLKKRLQISQGKQVKDALRDLCEYLDEEAKEKRMKGGTTLSVLLIREAPYQVWAANVGDSSMYGLFEKEKKAVIRAISHNHNVESKRELQRITEQKVQVLDGYVVQKNGPHMLAMTRSLGDWQFGKYVPAEPTMLKLDRAYNRFVLASDGIWDVLKMKKLWSLYREKNPSWRQAAKVVNDERNRLYEQHDNTTLIFVFVDRPIQEETAQNV